jgi:transposase InsO family protein
MYIKKIFKSLSITARNSFRRVPSYFATTMDVIEPKSMEHANARYNTKRDADTEAQQLAAEWLHDYNHVRPHSSLNYLTPMQFVQRQEAAGSGLVAVTPPASCRTEPSGLNYSKTLRPGGT